MYRRADKPALGFNLHTLQGYLLSVGFIVVVPLMIPANNAGVLLCAIAFPIVAILWVRKTKRFYFWTAQSIAYALLLALVEATQGEAVENQEAFEDKVPISAESLLNAPVSGDFLLSGASLDNSLLGSYENCTQTPSNWDEWPEPKFHIQEKRCTSATVTALKATLEEGAEAAIIGWVVRDKRPWPRFFGDRAPLPLRTYGGGFLGTQSSTAEQARENACKNWKQWQEAGRVPQGRSCPADAPLLYPVNTVTGPVADNLSAFYLFMIGLHSVIGWFLVLLSVIARAIRG